MAVVTAILVYGVAFVSGPWPWIIVRTDNEVFPAYHLEWRGDSAFPKIEVSGLVAVWPRVPFLWDMMPRYWMIGFWRFDNGLPRIIPSLRAAQMYCVETGRSTLHLYALYYTASHVHRHVDGISDNECVLLFFGHFRATSLQHSTEEWHPSS